MTILAAPNKECAKLTKALVWVHHMKKIYYD